MVSPTGSKAHCHSQGESLKTDRRPEPIGKGRARRSDPALLTWATSSFMANGRFGCDGKIADQREGETGGGYFRKASFGMAVWANLLEGARRLHCPAQGKLLRPRPLALDKFKPYLPEWDRLIKDNPYDLLTWFSCAPPHYSFDQRTFNRMIRMLRRNFDPGNCCEVQPSLEHRSSE